MRLARGPSLGLLGALLLFTTATHAQSDLPQLSTVTQPDGKGTSSASSGKASKTDSAAATTGASASQFSVTSGPAISTTSNSAFHLTGLPTIAGAGIPTVIVPDTAGAPFMQKSNLPDGTVFICVGAALGFMGAAILAWRGLVAWSLHRSVKRAAMAPNIADFKSMSQTPGKRRPFYTAVGGSSTLSLDRLSAAPPGHSKPAKPFSSHGMNASTPPKQNPSASSLFFSPTAGGAAGLRDANNRSSQYLPAGYYAAGNSAPASGSPVTHVGGGGPPSSAGYTRARSVGISPPGSPSLPPSRGYDRAPPSRGESMYDPRKSTHTVYSGGLSQGFSASNLSLNVPGGTSVAGGRAPSTYLEDLFENHGNGPRERF